MLWKSSTSSQWSGSRTLTDARGGSTEGTDRSEDARDLVCLFRALADGGRWWRDGSTLPVRGCGSAHCCRSARRTHNAGDELATAGVTPSVAPTELRSPCAPEKI